MPSNVIVLTAGLAGSWVVTGLVGRSGLWTGHETVRNRGCDAFENRRLIERNKSKLRGRTIQTRCATSLAQALAIRFNNCRRRRTLA